MRVCVCVCDASAGGIAVHAGIRKSASDSGFGRIFGNVWKMAALAHVCDSVGMFPSVVSISRLLQRRSEVRTQAATFALVASRERDVMDILWVVSCLQACCH